MLGGEHPFTERVLGELTCCDGWFTCIDRPTGHWLVFHDGLIERHQKVRIGRACVPVCHQYPTTAIDIHVDVDVVQDVVIAHHLVHARRLTRCNLDIADPEWAFETIQFGVRI
ncbi:hypothetical protein D3C81_2023990 [compost metagenome]